MNIPLKYLLPLLIFITGLFLVTLQTMFQMQVEYDKMKESSSKEMKIIGNRLANQIGLEVKEGILDKDIISRLVTAYEADNLDQIEVYDHTLEQKFARTIISLNTHKETFDRNIANVVIKDQYANVIFDGANKHIHGYFPIDLPALLGEKRIKRVGVIFIVFDVRDHYDAMVNTVTHIAKTNAVFVALMIIVLSSLMYYFVFRKLTLLHNATSQMAEGDFDVHVPTKGSNELTEVIKTFNIMAKQMSLYKNSMEEEIARVLLERTEQSKILVHQSRLASMGEMIGNIAHQWRQPLNALGLIVQKFQLYANRGKLTQEIVNGNVKKATLLIESMSRTIDDFKDFFRPNKDKELFIVSEVIDEISVIMDSTLKEECITLIIDVHPYMQIMGYKNEFSQVIINLINNAKDAIIENEILDGIITIGAKEVNDSRTIVVSDNAGGIPKKIIERIFEPYYTTKEQGKGTGIGLYMSKMIVEESMNGTISATNSGSGARFSMVFPKEKEI